MLFVGWKMSVPGWLGLGRGSLHHWGKSGVEPNWGEKLVRTVRKLRAVLSIFLWE